LSLEHVTIIAFLKRKCITAPRWCINVFTIRPDTTSHTLTVASVEPLIITLSSYWRHKTEPVCPVNTYFPQTFQSIINISIDKLI
jgi:hypothetical protein